MNRALLPAALAIAVASLVLAQTNSSAPAETEATIGGKTIAIKYHAPSASGRTVFGGAGAILQPNTVWRAGAGTPTTLYTNAELNFGGLDVPPGAYTLFVQTDPKGWQLIVSKEKGHAAQTYHKAQDLGRVAMTTTHNATPTDPMRITLMKSGGNGGTLLLAWADIAASVNFALK